MSKKNYITFAKMFKSQRPPEPTIRTSNTDAWFTWRIIVESTADIFAADNPQFNRQRFYAACGY